MKIKLKNRYYIDYVEEVRRIKNFVEEHGYEIGLYEAYELWQEFSTECYCAGFIMGIDNSIFFHFMEWLEK